MWQTYLLFAWLGFLLLSFLSKLFGSYFENQRQRKVDERLLATRPPDRKIPKYEWWLKNIEPKYAGSKFYGPDWSIRREYIAELYNHKCGNCGENVPIKSGHVHHVNRLGSAGTNSLDNLVFLCRHCHEDQHPHLKWRKMFRLSEIKRRGITEEQYFKESAEAYAFRKKYIYPQKHSQKPTPQQMTIEEKRDNDRALIPDLKTDNTKDDFAEIDNW